jgi:hypothetical protein
MNYLFLMIFQCGAIVFVPIITLVLGLMLIIRYLGFEHRYSFLITAILIGFVSFELSLSGIIMDPRSTSMGFSKIVLIAGLLGLVVFVLILVFGPIYSRLLRIFKP